MLSSPKNGKQELKMLTQLSPRPSMRTGKIGNGNTTYHRLMQKNEANPVSSTQTKHEVGKRNGSEMLLLPVKAREANPASSIQTEHEVGKNKNKKRE